MTALCVRAFLTSCAALLGLLTASLGPAHAASPRGIEDAYGRLPFFFTPGADSSDGHAHFVARVSGYTDFVNGTEAVFVVRPTGTIAATGRPGRPVPLPGDDSTAVVRMRLVGANAKPHVTPSEPAPGRAHHLIGRHGAERRI